MRVLLIGAVIIGLTACDSRLTDAMGGKKGAAALLEENDPSVCADEDVQRTVLQTVNAEYVAYLDAGGPALDFDLVSATEIKPEIHELTCSASVLGLEGRMVAGSALETALALGEDSPLPITFKVRPSLEKNYDFIIGVTDPDVLAGRLAWTILKWQNGQREDPAPSVPPENRTDAVADSTSVERAYKSPLQLTVAHVDQQKLASGTGMIALSGRVINSTDESQSVPSIRAELHSRGGHILYAWTIPPPTTDLAAGQSTEFKSAEVGVPAGGERVTVKFAPAVSEY